MKKSWLFLLTIFIIILSVATITVSAADSLTACPYCGRESEDWIAITKNSQAVADGHYYMNGNYVLGTIGIENGKTTCLDLRGNLLTENKNITVKNGGTMHVWNGRILTRGIAGTNGGVFSVAKGGKLFVEDVSITWDKTYGKEIPQGGYLYTAGVAELKGVSLNGGKATSLGGNVYVSSTGVLTLNNTAVAGGAIGNDTTHTARSVYSEGKVVLSGDSSAELIRMGSGASLEISGAYTGTAALYFDEIPAIGTAIGTITNSGSITDADISVVNAEREVRVSGNSLTINEPPVAEVNGVRYDNLENAIAAAGEYPLVLCRRIDTVTFNKDLTVDLAGCNIGELNAATGITVSVIDTKTDDYDISDGDYGKIGKYTGKVEGKVLGESERYLLCEEKDGVSFHKLRMEITQVWMRSSVAGLYFTSDFKGDSLVKSQVKSFGLELSLKEKDLQDQTLTGGRYTAINADKFNGDTAATSTVLTNVMHEEHSAVTNRINAATTVYARPYIKFAGEKLQWGMIKNMSLQKFVEAISVKETLEGMKWDQQEALLEMYDKFYSAIKHWNVDALEEFKQTREESVLKILTIGNSHANDSNWQLRHVFQQQNPNQQVVVGVLYKSGCTMSEHVGFATKNEAGYQYYKNCDGEWEGNDTPKDTMLDALQDEQWDVILLQEMNNQLGQESSFDNDNLQTLINYVKANTKGDPILGFNMVWANPVTETYWNADTRPTDLPTNWVERYESIYGLDQMYMYECMTSNVQKYIATNENINNDYIMPSGTAVQYANNVLGYTDPDLYRDYTHISEFSRLMVSYLWYAKLTGETFDSIDDIKVDVIPKHLRHSRFTSQGDMAITKEMKETIVKAINYAMEHPYEAPEVMSTSDPAVDNELNVLMVGNSFCYYYPDELVEMAKAAGQQLRICNVYYSGCTLAQHHDWLQKGDANYDFFVRDTDGTSTKVENVSLEYCLAQGNWDIITLQGGSGDIRKAETAEDALATNKVHLEPLLEYYRTLFPKARLAWHQTWAYQVGTAVNGTVTPDVEAQHVYDEKMRNYALLICEKYDLDRINTGEAWRIIRDGGYDNLCARLGKKWSDTAPENSGDNYHDGDIGGGQYLNACVWYEYLFGLDVRENTFVPTYYRTGSNTNQGTLKTDGSGNYNLLIDREKLQDAAHAVSSRWVSPSNDDEFNVLFIGDSASYYWTDELYGMLTSAGYKNVRVCNAYYSTELKNIWTYLQNDTAKFTLFTVDENGRHGQENVTLKYAIDAQKWDCISFHQGKSAMSMADKAVALANTEPYLTNLLTYAKKVHPRASYYWDENWVPEIGYSNSTYTMSSKEQQAQMLATLQYVAEEVSKKHGLTVIPNGDAWTPVRDLSLFTTPVAGTGVEKFTLCSRITAAGTFKDDLGHDGDIGGGQYLNACVVFEVLTGTSCLPSTYRPAYTLKGIDCSLTQEKIDLLKNAAHEAVTNWN